MYHSSLSPHPLLPKLALFMGIPVYVNGIIISLVTQARIWGVFLDSFLSFTLLPQLL